MIDEPDSEQGELLPTEQPTVDAASVRTYRRRKRKAELQERDAKLFWQGIFATETGRREMWKILESAHTFEERFACGPNGFPQVEATWFHAGEQAYGQRLYQTWQIHDFSGVFKMMTENDKRFMKRTEKSDER